MATKESQLTSTHAPPPTKASQAPQAIHPILRLQRAAGNYAVGRLLQAKLEIGSSNDPAEREAERMADVVASDVPEKQCACGTPDTRECEQCRSKDLKLSRSSTEGSALSGVAPPIVHAVLSGSGQPLSTSTKSLMEDRFGQNFAGVRIHTNSRAAESAKAVRARAYTVGNDVVFGEGQYAPDTLTGQRLLAHELTHVVQQGESLRRDPDTKGGGGMTSSRAPASVAGSVPTPDLSTGTRPTGPSPNSVPGLGVPPFKGKTISNDSEQMRGVLRQVAVEEGMKGVEAFVNDLVSPRADSREPFVSFMRLGGHASDLALEIISTASLQLAQLKREWNKVLRTFEEAATNLTQFILQESENRIRMEQLRYGIISKHDSVQFAPFANPEAKKGLAAAAQELSAKRAILDGLVKKQTSLTHTIYGGDSPGPAIGKPRVIVPEENQAAFNALNQPIEAARADVNLIRGEKEGLFPILAAYAKEGRENTSALASIGKSPEGGTGLSSLTKVVNDRRDDIAKVRYGLDHGQVNIWKSPVVFGGTRRQLGIEPGSWQNRAIEDRRTDGKPLELDDLLVGAIAIGLGLIAAIPTGGASVGIAVAVAGAQVATVAISAYAVLEAVQEYQLEKAQTGTDFDRAKAITQEDPSLFWLGLAVVGVALDLKDASRVLREVAPLVRRALAAETKEALKEGLELITKDPATRRIPDLVDRVKARYGSAEEVARRERVAAAQSLEKKVLLEADSNVLSQAVGASGHNIKVTKSGWIVRCSECAMLRVYYAPELVGSPEFVAKLQAAEGLGARAAAAERAGQKAEARELAEKSRQLADNLTADLDKTRRTRLIENPRLRTSRNRVPLRLDPAELPKALRQVEGNLGRTGLEADAITRILQKSPNTDAMRGQLVEELHSAAVRKLLSDPTEKAKLLGKGAPAGIEFIGGHRIQNIDGRQITDGIIGIFDREKGILHVTAISEAKAGDEAAKGLTTRRTPLSKAEVRKGAAEELSVINQRRANRGEAPLNITPDKWAERFTDLDELRRAAVEDLAAINQKRVSQGLAPLDVTPDEWAKQLKKDYVQGEAGGQPRSVLERMIGVAGDDVTEALPKYILVDGIQVQVEVKGARFLIATPSDVAVKDVPTLLKSQGITANLLPVNMTEAQVSGIFVPVADLVDAAEKAANAL